MSEFNELTFDHLLELRAEKLASRLAQDGTGLCPRLLSLDQAAVFLGRSREAIQHMGASGKLPTVRSDRRVFVDREALGRWIGQHKERDNGQNECGRVYKNDERAKAEARQYLPEEWQVLD